MYKLVIADDEKIIRDGLSKIINWSELGFEIAGVLSDGQEIVEYLEYMTADVILTDIKMLHLSGIDVAKYVYDNSIYTKVVFISGHKEFELALQGMKYGVEDYLLKPTNVKNLKEAFEKIKKNLDEKSKQNETEQAEKARLEEALPILKERFFSDLILGVVDNKELITNRMSILYPQINLECSCCILADIIITDYANFMDSTWKYNFDQFEINVTNFMNIYNSKIFFHIVYKSEELFEIFGILSDVSYSNDNAGKICGEEFEQFVYELTTTFNFQAKFEIKKIFGSIFEVIEYRETILSSHLRVKSGILHLQEQKKLIISNISIGNISTAQKIFHNILDELKNSDIIYRNNFIVDIFSTINEVIKSVNIELWNAIQPYLNYSGIIALNNGDETRMYCDRIFDKIKLAGSKTNEFDTGSLINKARQYIQDNITQDISQEETANQLYISTAHLSRLFKKQTGENFSQYVTRMKIDKAIELLRDPKYKTYQVSEYLSYKTSRYFSKLFRNQTGMNPSEYRSKVLNIGGEADDEV
ncbi:Two-component response regulator, YesN/AraC family, consists of REC and AraC-type DNA-binding domains [Anaerocolumna jejuensis DSM 15929]|uniref:Stage 0 sporulation protein A homolog n=1 Tax=Anaerocolumna jejuensis DSM 15929 TaxID=1121322 RepID=A0A1M6VT67_9FIRM|nr:response regulator [Anaerocolumna jejuensis]SHK84670.1 Two-component response regulator, YesN/AraC family, consists of REC and AraC-type DNA-binding domains [Anaerocolumna jejuensis DSM 15929]